MADAEDKEESFLHFERQLWQSGCSRVAGIDEAGRGPLAGPVVAAAVLFDRPFLQSEADGVLSGLDDSKKLTAARREHLFSILEQSPEVCMAVGSCSPEEIDRINILRATHLAMKRALDGISPRPDHALIDGLPVDGIDMATTAIVRGDSRSISIAAASIVAKVTRDRMMIELDSRYPAYGFSANKGYGTKAHMRALLEEGPCPIHRRSFQPVKDAEQIRDRSDDRQGWLGI